MAAMYPRVAGEAARPSRSLVFLALSGCAVACSSAPVVAPTPRIHVEQVEEPEAPLPAPSIAAAQAELVRAEGLAGAARTRAFARARSLLEAVTKVGAEPVQLRGSFLLPSQTRVETAKLPGTSFEIAGDAVLVDRDGLLVIERGTLLRYGPEPTTLLGTAFAPLALVGRYVRTSSGSAIRFADLASEQPRQATSDDRTFQLADGSSRTVETTRDDIRLIQPSGSAVVLDSSGHDVFIDDVAGRVMTYWPLDPLSASDKHVLELSVFDAKDGRRLAHTTEPPKDVLATPRVVVSPDGSRLLAISSRETSLFTLATGKWKTLGSYQLEYLGGGKLDAAFTRDGAKLCATWQDVPHPLPNDTPKNADAICTFEPRTPFHSDARIACVEREPGWVVTRSAARPVSVEGAAIATGVSKVAVLQHVAGSNPLPGGVAANPEVAVRLVVADADTCKIEHRIELGKRSLQNGEVVEISADGSIVALSSEAFEVSSGKPTKWSPAGMPPIEAGLQSSARCRFGPILAPIELCPG